MLLSLLIASTAVAEPEGFTVILILPDFAVAGSVKAPLEIVIAEPFVVPSGIMAFTVAPVPPRLNPVTVNLSPLNRLYAPLVERLVLYFDSRASEVIYGTLFTVVFVLFAE